MDDNEREQVELVFGLTGGELNDDAWVPWYVTDTFGEAREFHVQYNYDDVPYYAEEDHPSWPTSTHRTMVRDCIFGIPPDVVYDEQGMWEKVATYATSGETDCFCTEEDKGKDDCPLCEGSGYVYIGDGWAEVVYKLVGSDMEG